MPQNLEKALDRKTTNILQGEVASDLSEYLVMFSLLFLWDKSILPNQFGVDVFSNPLSGMEV